MTRGQMNDKILRICIAAFRGGPILDVKLPVLVEIIQTFSREVYTITVGRPRKRLFPFQGTINLCKQFLQIHKKVDVLICYATSHFPLPLLAHLLGKKIIYFKGGLEFEEYCSMHTESDNEGSIIVKLSTLVGRIIQRASYRISDKIVLVSPVLIIDPELRRFQRKISVARDSPGPHFYETFDIKKKFENRDLTVGYIGRLERVKGINQFAKAVPIIVAKMSDIKIIIVGDGSLGKRLEPVLSNYKNVKILGNVPHQKISDYLNEMRLLVLPSFFEGFGVVLFEAMACGTPVLATNVGAVPDLIINGKTGFLLESNSPGAIANSILKILKDPKIYDISKNTRLYVMQRYDYASTISSWKSIFANLYN